MTKSYRIFYVNLQKQWDDEFDNTVLMNDLIHSSGTNAYSKFTKDDGVRIIFGILENTKYLNFGLSNEGYWRSGYYVRD